MDITLARTFLEIVATGSFLRASERLHVTQTAVSARVRRLDCGIRCCSTGCCGCAARRRSSRCARRSQRLQVLGEIGDVPIAQAERALRVVDGCDILERRRRTVVEVRRVLPDALQR